MRVGPGRREKILWGERLLKRQGKAEDVENIEGRNTFEGMKEGLIWEMLRGE